MTKKDHNCTQQEHLDKIDLLLLGNGHPEDGFVFKVIAMAKDVGEIKKKLSVATEVKQELEIQSRVKAALEKAQEKADDKEVKSKSMSWQKIATIVGALSFLVMAVFAVLNYNLNKETHTDIQGVKTDVEIMVEPVTRGKPFVLPAFRNDSLK